MIGKLTISIFIGFLLGIILSQLFGIVGLALFNEKIGIKYLPFYTSVIAFIFTLVWQRYLVQK